VTTGWAGYPGTKTFVSVIETDVLHVANVTLSKHWTSASCYTSNTTLKQITDSHQCKVTFMYEERAVGRKERSVIVDVNNLYPDNRRAVLKS